MPYSRRSFLSGVSLFALMAPAMAGPVSLLQAGSPLNSTPSWVPNQANPPDIAVNWTTNQAWKKVGGLTTPATLGVTTSRASVKQVVDSNGNWSQVASNVTAQSNLGRSTEEARTNSIRNNTMQGAVAGSPGTLPTNWTSTLNGLTQTVVGTGTELGVDYVDLQYSGTASGTNMRLFFETINSAVAAVGQTWNESYFYKFIGATSNVTGVRGLMFGYTAGGAINETFTQTSDTSLSSALVRNNWSATFANTASVFVRPCFDVLITNGAAVSFTLRIGWPQLENNSINSTVASATVAAGGASGVSGTAVYSVGGGTGTAATLNVTVSGGAITAINSVASAGSYSVFPPSPAALTYVSGTGSGVVGATVNLTPTNLAANAFATSPIKTTAAAVTRAADVTTLTGLTFGAAVSLYEQATPQAPVTYGIGQDLLDATDGTTSNRLLLSRALTSGFAQWQTLGGGVSNGVIGATALAQNVSAKVAASFAAGAQAIVVNGAAAATAAGATVPTGINQISFGGRFGGGTQVLNGLAAIDAIWLTQAVPSAQLQSMTT